MRASHSQPHTLAQLKAGQLKGIKRLRLACDLTAFPPEIFELADTLEILDLSDNKLSSLPDDFNRLGKLKILFCSSNQFTEFPRVLGQSKSLRMIGFKHNQLHNVPPESLPTATLRWLILTDNQLQTLPDTLGACTQMQKLMLAGNQLTALPASLQHCQQLELLRISANQLQALPDWLFTLPKLAWLAYAGNPFCDATPPTIATVNIDWQELTLGKVLGQGASGVTYQAIWQPNDGAPEPVAVKLFKGEVTSDGLPGNEMLANLLVGTHSNLVGVKGMISQHPQGTLGLVMPLLDEGLQLLADPPSFDSCTRDVYPTTLTLTAKQAIQIAHGVASALRHLHAKGILHGDLYAHNILWSDTHVVLSDLGGASVLPKHKSVVSQSLKTLDALAYRILVEELANIAGLTDDEISGILVLSPMS